MPCKWVTITALRLYALNGFLGTPGNALDWNTIFPDDSLISTSL